MKIYAIIHGTGYNKILSHYCSTKEVAINIIGFDPQDMRNEFLNDRSASGIHRILKKYRAMCKFGGINVGYYDIKEIDVIEAEKTNLEKAKMLKKETP